VIAAQRGNWAESIAAAWLIENGYEIFRGDGRASADFVALRDGICQRVEVKAATHTRDGGKRRKTPCIKDVHPEKFDMLMVVLDDCSVLINPTAAQITGVR